jgi:hypothetical protein
MSRNLKNCTQYKSKVNTKMFLVTRENPRKIGDFIPFRNLPTGASKKYIQLKGPPKWKVVENMINKKSLLERQQQEH